MYNLNNFNAISLSISGFNNIKLKKKNVTVF